MTDGTTTADGGAGDAAMESGLGVDGSLGTDSGGGSVDAGCAGDSYGKSCAVATNLVTPTAGSPSVVVGVLPSTGDADWFVVTFDGSADPQKTYHPSVNVTGDPGVVFDVYSSCAGTALACGEGGSSVGETSWEVFYAQGDPTGSSFAPIAPVGNAGQVLIKVYRASGAPTCNAFALTVSNEGCGALDSVGQCGGCAQPCANAGPSLPQAVSSCVGTADGLNATCSYTCAAGYLDCDMAAKPDTNGCECNSPGATQAQCCPGAGGGACPIHHTTGLGQTFYDCNPLCTTNSCSPVAQDACGAFTGSASQCTQMQCLSPGAGDAGPTVIGSAWCATGSSTDCACWTFEGTGAGHAHDPHASGTASCICATSTDPAFQ
jgi:hypothetical protein